MQQNREIWLDNVKGIACALVAIGHLIQSLTPEILPESPLVLWFDKTIYFFHVPLFFICSGYLYQKKERIESLSKWAKNLIKKAIALGIPYVVFTALTWILKTAFSDSVNSQVDGLAKTLFIAPISPYWYLYALFFIFLITPTMGKLRTCSIALGVSLLVQIAGVRYCKGLPAIVEYLFTYEVWFILGMFLCMIREKIKRELEGRYAFVAGPLFIILSVFVYKYDVDFAGLSIIMGLLGCSAVICAAEAFLFKRPLWLSAYTMPIYLMHTLCAAPIRIVLVKLGVTDLIIHIAAGMIASLLLPFVIAKIAEKTKWLNVWIYPGKYLKIR